MKLASWNVNGLRACIGKGFFESVAGLDPDIICLQEVKLSDVAAGLAPGGYQAYWNLADKKGYSGTAIFTRCETIDVSYGIGVQSHDSEGRVITAEFESFYLVNCYTPNSQRGLLRLDYRMEWEDAFQDYICGLDAKKPVVLCGDLNVAHTEIDIKHPASNRRNAGFTDEERDKFTRLLSRGFIDSFRYFHPDARDEYSWWSYMHNARNTNAGWRIDYFCVSKKLEEEMVSAGIRQDIFGSDHCPVELELKL